MAAEPTLAELVAAVQRQELQTFADTLRPAWNEIDEISEKLPIFQRIVTQEHKRRRAR